MIADRQATDAPLTNRLCLSVQEAAGLIGISARGIYNLSRDAGLPTVKIGGRRLIRRSDLEAWLSALPVDRVGAP